MKYSFIIFFLLAITAFGSPKDGRTYAVINWGTPLTEVQFDSISVKNLSEGVIQTSLNTIRKSLDGTKAILKWRRTTPPTLINAKIIWSGIHSEMLQYLRDNAADWEVPES